MKFFHTFFLFIGIFFLNSFSVSAQTNSIPDSAVILFEKTILNFGKAKQGESKEVMFTFTNKGNKPLVVSDALRGCGCTSVKWTQEPVLPGKQGFVWATFNSNVGYGHIMKPIHIHSNATQPQMDIYIEGELLNEKFSSESKSEK